MMENVKIRVTRYNGMGGKDPGLIILDATNCGYDSYRVIAYEAT